MNPEQIIAENLARLQELDNGTLTDKITPLQNCSLLGFAHDSNGRITGFERPEPEKPCMRLVYENKEYQIDNLWDTPDQGTCAYVIGESVARFNRRPIIR